MESVGHQRSWFHWSGSAIIFGVLFLNRNAGVELAWRICPGVHVYRGHNRDVSLTGISFCFPMSYLLHTKIYIKAAAFAVKWDRPVITPAAIHRIYSCVTHRPPASLQQCPAHNPDGKDCHRQAPPPWSELYITSASVLFRWYLEAPPPTSASCADWLFPRVVPGAVQTWQSWVRRCPAPLSISKTLSLGLSADCIWAAVILCRCMCLISFYNVASISAMYQWFAAPLALRSSALLGLVALVRVLQARQSHSSFLDILYRGYHITLRG